MAETKAKTPRAKRVPDNETRNQAFVRLAKQRGARAYAVMAQIAKLGDRSYDSTPEQRAQVVKVLEMSLDEVRKAFSRPDLNVAQSDPFAGLVAADPAPTSSP